jgi:aspartate aminotransferase
MFFLQDIYVPDPTWGNHIPICRDAGFNVQKYRYYDATKNALNINGMLEDIQKAPNNSIILLHACAHNPTGIDPTRDQWKEIEKVCKVQLHLFLSLSLSLSLSLFVITIFRIHFIFSTFVT